MPQTQLECVDDRHDKYTGDNEDGVQLQPDEDDTSKYQEMVSLLPVVLEEMKKSGKLEDYLAFHRIVSANKFPLDNISYLLFLDVCSLV